MDFICYIFEGGEWNKEQYANFIAKPQQCTQEQMPLPMDITLWNVEEVGLPNQEQDEPRGSGLMTAAIQINSLTLFARTPFLKAIV